MSKDICPECKKEFDIKNQYNVVILRGYDYDVFYCLACMIFFRDKRKEKRARDSLLSGETT